MKRLMMGSALVISLLLAAIVISHGRAGIHSVHADSPADGLTRAECREWVDRTYRIEAMGRDLGLDLAEVNDTMRACVAENTRHMAVPIPVDWCDNIFKIHCSGLDVLTEIGEAQVKRCSEQLGQSLGVRLDQYSAWNTCAEDKIFTRYSMGGESSDSDACRSAFLDECASSLDPIPAEDLSAEQQDFVECCSAADTDHCPMIDDGFERGPCLDHAVCINRNTDEWLSCSALE